MLKEIKIITKHSIQKKGKKKVGIVMYACNPSYTGNRHIRRTKHEASLEKMLARPHLNQQTRHGETQL
jgi:hypothetical protein